MTSVDLNALVSALDPEGRGGRRHVDDVATAIRNLIEHAEAASIPQLVLDTILLGEQEGRWAASRTSTEVRGNTVLPKSVLLLHRSRPNDKRRLMDVPLRPELASWAANVPLSGSQRALLLAVNEWLTRTDGGNVPVVAAAERAYELIGDEKAFDSSPPRGGATLWQVGRLTFELLRCERSATPLTWEPVTSTVGDPGPIVCVENHATFRTLLRVLREQETPSWLAVAWVQGRNTAPLESLSNLPFPVTRLDYLGDLDPAGLEIAASACTTAQAAGVPAGPAVQLWTELLTRPPRPGRQVSVLRAAELTSWLPEPVRLIAAAILTSGQAIPQEALRYDVLAAALNERSPAGGRSSPTEELSAPAG